MSFYFNESKSGPPDLEEWFKKIGRTFSWKKKSPFMREPQNKEASPWWWLCVFVVLLVVMLIFSSVVTVKATEKMVVMRFGAFAGVEGPGVHWTLPLVDQRTIIDVSQVQGVADEGRFLTQENDLIKMNVVLNYQITDPQKYLFYGSVPALLQKQLAAASALVLLHQAIVPLLSVHAWPDLNTKIQAALPDLSAYGVVVTGVQVQNVALPDNLDQDFNANVLAAENQVKTLIDEANHFAASLQPLAAAAAAQALTAANSAQFTVLIQAQKDAAEIQSLQAAYALNPALTTAYLPSLLAGEGQSLGMIVPAGGSSSQAAYLRWHAAYQQGAQNEAN